MPIGLAGVKIVNPSKRAVVRRCEAEFEDDAVRGRSGGWGRMEWGRGAADGDLGAVPTFEPIDVKGGSHRNSVSFTIHPFTM